MLYCLNLTSNWKLKKIFLNCVSIYNILSCCFFFFELFDLSPYKPNAVKQGQSDSNAIIIIISSSNNKYLKACDTKI